MKVSIVIPVFNEERSLPELSDRIQRVFASHSFDYEIIYVNDGSQDASQEVLNKLASDDQKVKVIHLRRNFGQTAALSAGIEHTTGEVTVLMDSDLENHPEDIPRLLEKIGEGYDVVSGWRKERWADQMITRKLPSAMANFLISRLAKLKLNDYGCTLKAYRTDAIKGIRLYGDMHRFIPAYLSWQGARVCELPVEYTPRKHGKSNYGLTRTFKVILDLVVMKFMTKYFQKPMHFFGAVGLTSVFFGFLTVVWALYYKFSAAHHKDFISTPLPVIIALFLIVGVLFILMGLLAEILVRTYHESQGKPTHEIKEKKNF